MNLDNIQKEIYDFRQPLILGHQKDHNSKRIKFSFSKEDENNILIFDLKGIAKVPLSDEKEIIVQYPMTKDFGNFKGQLHELKLKEGTADEYEYVRSSVTFDVIILEALFEDSELEITDPSLDLLYAEYLEKYRILENNIKRISQSVEDIELDIERYLQPIIDTKMEYYAVECVYKDRQWVVEKDGVRQTYELLKEKFDDISIFLYLVSNKHIYIPSIDITKGIEFYNGSIYREADNQLYPENERVLVTIDDEVLVSHLTSEIVYNKIESLEDYEVGDEASYYPNADAVKTEINKISDKLTGVDYDITSIEEILNGLDTEKISQQDVKVDISLFNKQADVIKLNDNIDVCIQEVLYGGGESGFRKYRNGMIEQWGVATTVANETEFTMHQANNNMKFSVFITPREQGNFFVYAIPSANNKFKCRVSDAWGNPMAVKIQWHSIGRWK